jgi:glycosyltransferase involved in cell wall biosynthesis
MKVLVFCNRMPDLCGAFLHDIDLGLELQKRGHQVTFMVVKVPKEGYYGGTYRGFRFMHYTAATNYLESSDIWICPHSPILPEVRKINSRGYNRPIVATCHFDGNYTAITGNFVANKWSEMLMFINRTMEPNYRKNIHPWPSNIVRTEVIRPIMHEDKITITGEFEGDCITLINANLNKGVHQFIDMAKAMPRRKFLGVLPYYGELRIPPSPGNIEWIPFDDDIRNILKRTRILLVPSYYESFGRVAVEAMINGIPVLYSKPAAKSVYPGGSTEGMEEWIGDAGISCNRDIIQEWTDAIVSLDDADTYSERSKKVKAHIHAMNLFTEAPRISQLIEEFSREHPVVTRSAQSAQSAPNQLQVGPAVPRRPVGPVGFGFSNGQLKIRR